MEPSVNPVIKTNLFLERFCIPDYASMTADEQEGYNNLIGSFGIDDVEAYISDVKVCAYYYVWGLLTCVALALFYNFLLIYIAGVLTWISIFVIGVCMVALGFWIEDYSTENYPHDSDTKKYLDYFVYAIWGFTGIYFLCILCMYQSIRISI
jgi:hypothetical protein